MSFSIEDNLYNSMKPFYINSPQAFKTFLGKIYRTIPNALKYGETYKRYLSLLENSQYWSIDKIAEYQWRKISELLNHAYQNVPYYRTLFDERGLSIKEIQNFHDFKKIPFLTKELVRSNIHNLVARNIRRSAMLPVTTGGSTGTPLRLYYEKGVSRSMENAFILTQWKRCGYHTNDKVIVIRGEIINNLQQKAPHYFDPIKNSLVLSSYQMQENNLPDYIGIIRNFKAKWLHVYPSSLNILAKYMSRKKIKNFESIKGIFASSETINDLQLGLFEKVFRCKVYHWYGLNEQVALGGVCKQSDSYHFYPEYSYVEFVNPVENIIDNENPNIIEIVGTSFTNKAMPLIRYRTSDYGIVNDHNCGCGRNHKLVKSLIGRKQEFFIDKKRNLVTFTGYTKPIRPIVDKITAYQYIQDIPGSVRLCLEINEKLLDSDINIINSVFKSIWPRFDLTIEFVDTIPTTKIGKFRFLIQNV